MLNLDVSKAIPRGVLSYLTALVPGLFFELSILLGNPRLLSCHLDRLQDYVPLGPYLQLVIALFFAFIVGSAFMVFVSFVQHFLCYLHSLRLVLREELARWPLIPLLSWLHRYRFFGSRQRFHNLYVRTVDRLHGFWTDREVYRAWNRFARKLLLDRYGIDLSDVDDEWQHLFWVLGTPTDVEWRGPLLMIAFEATGWCGLVATRLAPMLRNPYYYALCALFILAGLHNDYYIAGRRTDPIAITTGRIRAVLREYDKDTGTKPPTKEPPEHQEHDSP
jgi:ABC-type multidrug transport system fused ATPase/permease subunit